MDTAAECVFGTVELLEQIITALPLFSMLRSRRVSRLFRDLIDNSQTMLHIRSNPKIEVHLRLPVQCSLSALPPMLEADLVLMSSQPFTVRLHPLRLSHRASGLVYWFEQQSPPPGPRATVSLGHQLSRPLRLSRQNEDKYVTLLPGVPHKMSWEYDAFNPVQLQNVQVGPSTQVHAGNTYNVRLWSDITLTSFAGVKRSILTRLDAGEDIGWGEELALVGRNGVSFTVTP